MFCYKVGNNIIKINQPMLATQKNNDIIEQIKRLTARIANLSQTKLKFFEFLIKSQQMFTDNSKLIKNQIENFEDAITKKSFYSVGKCKNMKKLIFIYKHLCTFVQDVSKLNVAELKKIDTDSSKQEEKVQKKADSFLKAVADYNQSQWGYNKQYGEYQYLCQKLNAMMVRSKSFENPINFYNLNMAADFSKNLDKKYHDSENKQLSLISFIQLLDQKRKRLSENLVDIKQQYIYLLLTHMTNILNATTCLTDTSKDDMHKIQSIIAVEGGEGDVFNQEIRQFDVKYGKNNQREEEIFSDLKQLFNSNSPDVQISSDQRLFLDRCQNFIQKKIQSVQQFLFLKKKMVEFIQNQISICQKIDKQYHGNEKSVFKSNGTDDFKKNIRKYFGEGTLNIVTLSLNINEMPKRRFDKIQKMFQAHVQKLKRTIQKKQQQLKKFKKRINQILSQHNNASRGVQNSVASISQFKNNIDKTFTSFKNTYDEFTRNESAMDLDFEQVLKTMISFIRRQSEHFLLNYNLNKQKQKLLYNNVFKKFNTQSQIIEIVKEDTRYEILFNEPLKPNLFNEFKSQIQKKKFEQTKNILKKKQNQSRGIIIEGQPGCCGMQSGRVAKYSKFSSFKASLLTDDNVYKNGKLQILNKGLLFEEKKKNLFAQKIEIIIPTKQIVSFSHKNTQQGQNVLQIMTSMGPICFFSQDYNQIQQNLQKHLGTRIAVREQNNSRLEKSSGGDSSSFMKQNNTSTQYKVSFEKSVITPEMKSNLNKWNRNANTDAVILKRLIQNWRKQKLLSDLFIIQSNQPVNQTSGSMRFDYRFQNEINKFLLKQKRSIKIANPAENIILLLYEWKVSFPEMPMLKSFTHGQQAKIELTPASVNIKITERNRGQCHLFVRKTFYTEIDKMNKKFSDFIVECCERQAKVNIEQEPESEQSSTIMLDMENLALDKQQVQSKHDRVLKRLSSGNIQLESMKGGNSTMKQNQP